MADNEDKTENATSRRLGRAREQGNVAVSREVAPFAALSVLWLVLSMMAPAMAHELFARLAGLFANAGRIDVSDGGAAALNGAMGLVLRTALPVALAGAAAGAGGLLLQTGFLFLPHRLIPDLTRLNPARGLKRLFSLQNAIEAAKAIAKVTVVGLACWHVLASELPHLRQAVFWEPAFLLGDTARAILHVLAAMLATQAVVVAGDLFWVRYRHARDLRMTRAEVREEHKESEGDPVIKRRLRQIRTMRARRRMREAVKRATVVVANPTHYAVALRYERARTAAPVVVAKGIDSMAARIREAAAEFRVPVVVNPPLARALHKVDIDSAIPAELYKAVAELIAYVWRLSGRRMDRHGHLRAAS